MISKKLIKNRLNNTPNPIRQQDFLDMHIAVEGYLKHLFLVGLRLQGCTYKESVKVIQSHHIKLNSDTFKAAFRLMKSKKSWHQIKNKAKRLRELEKLCYDYTSKVRNIIVHGNFYRYKSDELKLLYEIDKAFIEELELTMEKLFKGNTILKNTPTNFGAKKGTISDISKIASKLNQSAGLKPISFTTAQSKYNKL